jgi:lipoprotein-releasing system ATP-binding protein
MLELHKNIFRREKITMHNATLAAQNISKTFTQGNQTITVLKDITCTFEQNKSYAITGISGSGKSTFIHILAGLDTPTTGAVIFNNSSLELFSPTKRKQFLNKSVGLVFQSPHLLKELSVIENIIIPGLINGRSHSDCQIKAIELLTKIELIHKKDSKIGELSGGQQQRVTIARALFNEPAFLIADEPTGNLDLATGTNIIDLLIACQKEWGMGIIISSHDEYVAEKMDEVYQLSEGTLCLLKTKS